MIDPNTTALSLYECLGGTDRIAELVNDIFEIHMENPIIKALASCFSLPLTLCMLLLAGSLVSIEAHAQDAPLSWTADDPDLEWGPCPAFMPESCEIAVLHGPPDAPNADIFFKMAANSTVPTHSHTSVERMVLVSGEMEVTYDGHDPVVLKPGTYAYGPPELPHDASCANGEDCILFIAFEEPIDAMPVEQ